MMISQGEEGAEAHSKEVEVEDEGGCLKTKLLLNVSNAINWDTINMSSLIG